MDATAALQELSKMVINNRKVFAEYRRLRPGEREKKDHHEKRNKKFSHFSENRQTFEKDIAQETDVQGKLIDKRAAFFAKRETVKKVDEQKRCDERAERDREREDEFRKRLVEYAQNEQTQHIEDVIFESSLTSYERRMVHTISSGLGLGHISRFDDDGNRVLHVTKDPERKAEWEKETAALKAAQRKEDQEQKRKNKENGDARMSPEWKKVEPTTGGAITKDELQGIKWFKPRAAATDGVGAASGIRPPSYKMYIPPRQPTGPDGTIGFSSRNRSSTPSHGSSSQDLDLGREGSICDTSSEASVVNGTSLDGIVLDGKSANEEKGGSPKKRNSAGKSSQSLLNPSVPAFSPSYASFS